LGQELERVVVDGRFKLAQAADFVRERTSNDCFDLLDR
jgi:hypothetical protein